MMGTRMASERWRKIEELYYAALEGGGGVLPGTDPDVKREVERLPAVAPTGQGLLDMPAAELLPESTVASKPARSLAAVETRDHGLLSVAI